MNSLIQFKSLIFSGFHYFALAWTFIVDSAQVKHAMHYNAKQFRGCRHTEFLGVGGNGVEGDEYVAPYPIVGGIVEGDYVGEVVVADELSVGVEDIRVVAEAVSDAPHVEAMGTSYGIKPSLHP